MRWSHWAWAIPGDGRGIRGQDPGTVPHDQMTFGATWPAHADDGPKRAPASTRPQRAMCALRTVSWLRPAADAPLDGGRSQVRAGVRIQPPMPMRRAR